MRTALLLVLAALVGMSTGCSKPVTGPSFHAPKGTSYFGDITQPFSFTVASPVLVDPGKGTAFFVVAALDGQFYAFDRDQGKRIGRKAWARLPKGVRGTPFADQVNRQLLVGCYDKAVYALDMGTGAPRWRAQVDGYVQAPVALVGAAAVVGTSVGSLYGLSPLDGSELWRIPLGNGIFAEAGVHPSWPSRALVGTSGGKCAVIDTALGKVLSEFQVNGGLESGPSVAEIDGALYGFVGTREGELSAWRIQGDSAASAWSHPTIGGDIWASPAVAPPPGGGMGGVVYAVSNASAVTAFDAASGTQLWQAPLNPRDQLHATPLVVGDRLYVASMNHHLYYLDRGTGTPISWTDPAANTAVDSFRAFGEFRAAPIVDRDRLIAISNDHFLYGLDWEYPRPIVGAFRPAAAPPVLDLTKGAGQEAPPVPPEMLQEEVGAALQLALGAIVAADAKALAPYLQEEDPTKRDIYAVAALEAYRPFALKEFQLTSVTPATAGDAVATVVWEATRNGSPVQLILALHVLKDAIRDPAWRIEPGTLKPVRVIDIPVLSAPHGETAPATSNPPAEPPADASGGH